MATTTVVGSLMSEHKLILRMIGDMRLTVEDVNRGGQPRSIYIDTAVDFLRTYADRCHHGKEEDILFRDLGKKKLTDDDAAAMQELIEDHAWARRTTGALVDSAARHFTTGDGLAETVAALTQLVGFYPVHIDKENRLFFPAAMRYFDFEERQAMAAEFADFDRMLIHEKYAKVVEAFEAQRTGVPA